VVALEGGDLDREKEARFSMLEKLADHDDALMEQLLDDIQPPRDRVFDDLAKELRERVVCPVLLGSATRSNGVLRLLKALRHEAPGIAETAARLGVKPSSESVALTIKTFHTAHGGKMSVARVLTGTIGDGTTLCTPGGDAGRVSGVFKLMGSHFDKRAQATAGETVALGKLDNAKTGMTLSTGKQPHAALGEVKPLPPVLAIASPPSGSRTVTPCR
jgi:elongation factor G